MKAATSHAPRLPGNPAFQSTPPVKAATFRTARACQCRAISIHAAREGGDAITDDVLPKGSISIHAAREGGDAVLFGVLHAVIVFQSTPPVKAATLCPPKNRQCASISIHAARDGGDGAVYSSLPIPQLFQSTPPVKAATCLLCVLSVLCYISIHAAREGGDRAVLSDYTGRRNFNPRRP